MISATTISEIVKDSLYKSEELSDPNTTEPPEGALIGRGIMRNFAFHPERLESHRAEVVAMIEQLNKNFLPTEQGGGGGWSFLQLAMDKDDHQWGEHPDCEELIAIAMGLGLCEYAVPQSMWKHMPGGVPYVIFRLTPKE